MFSAKSRRQLIGHESGSVVGSGNVDDAGLGSGRGFGIADVGGTDVDTLHNIVEVIT